MQKRLKKGAGILWPIVKLAGQKFMHIDGGQRAASFAYSGFFALFPLIILFVTAASFFTDKGSAAAIVISYVEKFIPSSGATQAHLFESVSRVIAARGQASLVAFVMLVWVAAQLFTTLIQATNRAWGTTGNKWWNLPAKSLALLGTITLTVLAGVGVPIMAKLAAGIFNAQLLLSAAYTIWLYVAPWMVVFFSLMFFYKMAPHRRTRYAEVWPSALCAALLLNAAQNLFVLYLKHFASFNAVYGTFGGIMALLLWIYISGVIFIFCACLGAAQAAVKEQTRG